MSNPEGVRAVVCPSCGARIHVAEGKYQTTCDYCGALLELPRPSMPESTPIIIVAQGSPTPRPAGVRPRVGGVAIIVTALVMLAVVGFISFLVVQVLDNTGLPSITSASGSFHASMPAMILPGDDGGASGAVIYTYDGTKDTRFLVYFDGATRDLRWQTDPLGDDSYRTQIAASDTLVFAAVKTDLMAIDRVSGTVVWDASISDEIPSSCPGGCLRVVGSRVVALSSDGRLTGFDAPSGRVVWSIRLDGTPDQFFIANGQIGVFDRRDGKVVLPVIDAMDGSEKRVLTPECLDESSGFVDEPDLNSPVVVAPDQDSVVMAFGFFSSCVQRWNVTTGSPMWNAMLGDLSFSPAFDPGPKLSGNSIYVAPQNQLVRINMADGEWELLVEDPDYEFVPLEARGDILITRAKRTRGTTRFELWGVNLSTGRLAWQHPLPGSEPLDGPDSMVGLIDKQDSAWTSHLAPAGLIMVTATADPHQLTVETLDPATGTSGGASVIPLTGISGDFYAVPDIMGWYRDQLWMIVEGRMLVVDPGEGKIALAWP